MTATQNTSCDVSGTTAVKKSTFTISNTSSNTAQVEIAYSTNNTSWTSQGIQTISSSQPYSINQTMTTNYIIYRYRVYNATNPNNWQYENIMAPADCSPTTSSVSAFNTNLCINNNPQAKLNIINPNSTEVVVSYDISINGGAWQAVGTTSGIENFPTNAYPVPANSTFQWRYKTSTETEYKYASGTAENCSQVSSLSGFTEITCSQQNGNVATGPQAQLVISNFGSQAVSVMYDYKIGDGQYLSGSVLSVNPNESLRVPKINIAESQSIVFRYKSTSDTEYQFTDARTGVECGSTINNPQMILTLNECSANVADATIEVRNLSNEVKTFYLEYRINDGSWVNYGDLTINGTAVSTRSLRINQNQKIQWRALDSSYTQFAEDAPYQLSNAETAICDTAPTTTVPELKYIFEPLISTNRVCDFENGGAEFGITVDNSRSNVDAEVLKKIWINTTLIAEQRVLVPAGQMIDFSSIEVAENKFFTVALEVTNTQNGKVQKMIKNKDADCIQDNTPLFEEQNPLPEVQREENTDNVMRGEGDNNEEKLDNGESLQFLPGDDYVEFVYNEDAEGIFPTDPIEPTPPPSVGDKLPVTGRNVGGLLISVGLLLFACLLYTSPSPRDLSTSRMPSSA